MPVSGPDGINPKDLLASMYELLGKDEACRLEPHELQEGAKMAIVQAGLLMMQEFDRRFEAKMGAVLRELNLASRVHDETYVRGRYDLVNEEHTFSTLEVDRDYRQQLKPDAEHVHMLHVESWMKQRLTALKAAFPKLARFMKIEGYPPGRGEQWIYPIDIKIPIHSDFFAPQGAAKPAVPPVGPDAGVRGAIKKMRPR